MARLPAHNLEQTVETNLRQKIMESINLDPAKDHELISHINANLHTLTAKQLVKSIAKVIIDHDKINIHLDITVLAQILEQALEIWIPNKNDSVITIEAPFNIKRARSGISIVQTNTKSDPLDLSPVELNQLIKGTIWRDEHFSGLSISYIARRESLSDAYIGRLIHNSLN